MSTVTSSPRRTTTPAPPRPPVVWAGEQRIVIRNVRGDLYDLRSEAVGERHHVYLAHDGKDLEIMTKGRIHEVYYSGLPSDRTQGLPKTPRSPG